MIRNRSVGVLGLLLVSVTLAACTGTRAVYRQANTPVEFAKAALQHHNAIGLEVAQLAGDPEVSATTKDQLRTAYRATVCSSGELQAGIATGECDEGPAYQTDAAIRAFELARTATAEADVVQAANAFLPLLTRLLELLND